MSSTDETQTRRDDRAGDRDGSPGDDDRLDLLDRLFEFLNAAATDLRRRGIDPLDPFREEPTRAGAGPASRFRTPPAWPAELGAWPVAVTTDIAARKDDSDRQPWVEQLAAQWQRRGWLGEGDSLRALLSGLDDLARELEQAAREEDDEEGSEQELSPFLYAMY